LNDTTGFSRVVLQLQPNWIGKIVIDTIGFSRVEFQFRPILLEKQSRRLKLKLHAAEADGICDHLSAMHLGSS